jgi:hypothetical protein
MPLRSIRCGRLPSDPSGYHPLYGGERATATGNRDLQRGVDLLWCGLSLQRDLVHIN